KSGFLQAGQSVELMVGLGSMPYSYGEVTTEQLQVSNRNNGSGDFQGILAWTVLDPVGVILAIKPLEDLDVEGVEGSVSGLSKMYVLENIGDGYADYFISWDWEWLNATS